MSKKQSLRLSEIFVEIIDLSNDQSQAITGGDGAMCIQFGNTMFYCEEDACIFNYR